MIFKQIIQHIIEYRKTWMFFLIAAMGAGVFQTAKHLRIDNSVSIWFLEDNPDYQSYLQFQADRGSDEVVVVMIPDDDIWSKKHLTKLSQLHYQLNTLPFVKSSFSVANAQYPIYSNRKIRYRPIFQPDRSPENIQKLLGELPSLKQQLVTEKETHTFLYVQLQATNQIEGNRNQIVTSVTAIIKQHFPASIISGQPILNEAFNATIFEESTFFALATVAIILLLLLFLLPHWWYIPIALFSIAIPVSVSMGIMTSLGYSLNLISMLIPTILMVYSVSDVIHIINIFHQNRQESSQTTKNNQIINALQQSLKPCFYTTLTTIVGYLALCASPLPAFKIMGLFTFLGLGISFCLVYAIATIGFSFLPHTNQQSPIKTIRLGVFTDTINAWTSYKNTQVLTTGSLLFIIGLFAIPYIPINTDSLDLLGNGKAKQDLYQIEEALGGNARFQINIVKKDGSSILEAADLRQLQKFQTALDSNMHVSQPISILNFQAFLEKRMPPFSSLNNIKIGRLLKNQSNANDFFSLYSEDLSEVSMPVFVKELATEDLEKLLKNIKNQGYRSFPEATHKIEIHGFLALFAQLNQFILQTQFRSFGLAFLIAFGILFYFIGHLKIAFLALLPNLLPLSLIAIIMAFFSIDMAAANAMLAPILLGISMDDTIHLMNKFKHYKQAGHCTEVAMNKAVSFTGSALFSTTISLVCGFLVVGFSDVKSVSIFGLLCAFAIVAALFSDLLLLPALIKRFGR